LFCAATCKTPGSKNSPEFGEICVFENYYIYFLGSWSDL
jgi:hypothetical protein